MALCVAAGACAVVALASVPAGVGREVGGREAAGAVVVREAGGGEVARVALAPSRRFALEYRHSYYRAPAREWFVADGGSAFRLEAIASPSEAVLDYYALEGRKRKSLDGWLALEPRHPRRYRELALIATAEGRRTLMVGARKLPLFGPRARVRHLTVSIEQ